MAYQIVDLVPIIADVDLNDPEQLRGLLLRLQKNFEELQAVIEVMQAYENNTGIPTNETVEDKEDVWDKSDYINEDGTFPAWSLEGTIDTMRNEIKAGKGTVTVTDDDGIIIVDDKDNPTKALRLLGGMFAIANEKDDEGEWLWRTFGDGSGFTADLLTSGRIRTNLIQIGSGTTFEEGYDPRDNHLYFQYSIDGETNWHTTFNPATDLYMRQKVGDDGEWTDAARIAAVDGYTPVKGTDYFDGIDGQDGVNSYLWIRYSQNADGSGMTTNPTGAKYIGVATTTTASAPTSYTSYLWSLIKGADGIPGETGADGQTSYLHIKYSNNGTTFTSNNGEDVGDWIGTYVDFTEADSTSFSRYTWNKIKGADGESVNVFTSTPTTPYYVGDIWVKSDGSTWVCKTTKTSGAYSADHWRDVSGNKFDAPGYVVSTNEGIKVFDNLNNLRVLLGSWISGTRKYGLRVIDGIIEADVLIVNKTAFTVDSILDGFGNGSDGVFNSTGNVTLPIATADASSVIKQYTSFTLNAGHTLTVDKRCRGLFIFCQGGVTINGTINMDGRCGKVGKENSVQRLLQIPVGVYVLDVPAGGTGGNGGAGGAGGDSGGSYTGGPGGAGGTGAAGVWFGGGIAGPAGGGGSGAAYSVNGNTGGAAGGNNMDLAIGSGGSAGATGGNFSGGGGASRAYYSGRYSGPGGGGAGVNGGALGYDYGGCTAGGSGGGIGGGLIVIVCKGNLTIGSTGIVSARGLTGGNGGNGGNAADSDSSGGGGGGGQGGGGGGVIVLAYRGTYSNAGTVRVNGGSYGTGGTYGTGNGTGKVGVVGSNGTSGTVGTIVTARL